MSTQNVSKAFAAMLLRIGAVQINVVTPFDWASGWRSPVYCNNRRILSFPDERLFTKELLANLVMKQYGDKHIVIAGVATGAIGIGALVADLMGLSFVYVRSEPKAHGLKTQIEGITLTADHKVVVLEDLVSTGKSSLHVVDVIRGTGAKVLGMAALFTYGFPIAEEAFQKAGVVLHTLSNYSVLTEVAEAQQLVQSDDKPVLEEWRLDPANWKPPMAG